MKFGGRQTVSCRNAKNRSVNPQVHVVHLQYNIHCLDNRVHTVYVCTMAADCIDYGRDGGGGADEEVHALQ